MEKEEIFEFLRWKILPKSETAQNIIKKIADNNFDTGSLKNFY